MKPSIFYEKVKQFIVEKNDIQPEEIQIDEYSNLIRQGLIDSFMIMEIILLMEQLTERAVDMENLTVGHIESMRAMYEYFVQGSLQYFDDQDVKGADNMPVDAPKTIKEDGSVKTNLYVRDIYQIKICSDNDLVVDDLSQEVYTMIGTKSKSGLKGFEALSRCVADILVNTTISRDQIEAIFMVSSSQDEFLEDLNQYNAILIEHGLDHVYPLASFYPGTNKSLEGLRLVRNYLLSDKLSNVLLIILDSSEEDQSVMATGCMVSLLHGDFLIMDMKQVTDYALLDMLHHDKMDYVMKNHMAQSHDTVSYAYLGEEVLSQLCLLGKDLNNGEKITTISVGDIQVGRLIVQKVN
jgi:acyl carrier protein